MFAITWTEMSNGQYVANHSVSTESLWTAITILTTYMASSNNGDFTVTKDGEPYPELIDSIREVYKESIQ